MDFGNFTYSSVSGLSDYRASLTAARVKEAMAAAEKRDAEKTVENPVSEKPVNPRTAQALIWGGLVPKETQNPGWQSYSGQDTANQWNSTSSYKAPKLELSYDFVTLQKMIAYREVLRARAGESSEAVGQNVSTKS
tara:strand:+ start:1534 stop:1941 length:408 start_codon:yes stop_codon:yes gene_type:complete